MEYFFAISRSYWPPQCYTRTESSTTAIVLTTTTSSDCLLGKTLSKESSVPAASPDLKSAAKRADEVAPHDAATNQISITCKSGRCGRRTSSASHMIQSKLQYQQIGRRFGTINSLIRDSHAVREQDLFPSHVSSFLTLDVRPLTCCHAGASGVAETMSSLVHFAHLLTYFRVLAGTLAKEQARYNTRLRRQNNYAGVVCCCRS